MALLLFKAVKPGDIAGGMALDRDFVRRFEGILWIEFPQQRTRSVGRAGLSDAAVDEDRPCTTGCSVGLRYSALQGLNRNLPEQQAMVNESIAEKVWLKNRSKFYSMHGRK